MPNIQFSLYTSDDGRKVVTAFVNGQLTAPADDSHPNFTNILAACQASLLGEEVDTDKFLDLFDVAKAVEREFERLGERVTVKGNQILFDGDPVTGPLEDQILAFLNAGEDFGPLVAFYEKLSTNPLGNVREGLFTWIRGQKESGNFTITPEGDILGYKAVRQQPPEWRKDEKVVWVPSRRSSQADILNGQEVPRGSFIEQVPGDVVEMPRSKVLDAPSEACGDGLHIGTFQYAQGFMSGAGAQVMLVKFSPRDIVSLPDSNSSWKLRVCRYTLVEPVDEPLESILYAVENAPDLDLTVGEPKIGVGDKVRPRNVPNSSTGVVVSVNEQVAVDFIGRPDAPLFYSPEHLELVEEASDLSLSLGDATVSAAITDLDYLEAGDIIVDDDGDKGVITEVDENGDLCVDFSPNGPSNYWIEPSCVESAQRPVKATNVSIEIDAAKPQPKRDSRGRFVS